MINDEILNGMARALFVTAWADWAENAGYSFSGCELTEVAPKTAATARDHALLLYGAIEEINPQWGRNMPAILAAARRADGIAEDDSGPDDRLGNSYEFCFGWYLAMQALGHGVGWFDDHAKFELHFPFHTEFYPDEMTPDELDPEGEYPAARLRVGDEVWKTGAEIYGGDNGEDCELSCGSRGIVRKADHDEEGRPVYKIEWERRFDGCGETVTLEYRPAEDGTDYLEV